MNYFLLAETKFLRRISEAGNCSMEMAYTAFTTQVIELYSGSVDINHTIITPACIGVELQHHPVRNLPEKEGEVAACTSRVLSFVRRMQKSLTAPQVSPLIPIHIFSDNTTEGPASPLRRTNNTIDLAELIYGVNETGRVNNSSMSFKQLAPLLYKIFGVESKGCCRLYTDIKRRKNESRTYRRDRVRECSATKEWGT